MYQKSITILENMKLMYDTYQAHPNALNSIYYVHEEQVINNLYETLIKISPTLTELQKMHLFQFKYDLIQAMKRHYNC